MIQAYSAGDFANSLVAMGPSVSAGIPQSLQRPLAMLFQSDVRRQFYSGVTAMGLPFQKLKHPRPAGGDKPLLNTGVLANSYIAEASASAIEVSSSHPSAALHQAGGIVKPRNAKALTIPLTKEAARYGSPRRFPRKLFPVGRCLCEAVESGRGKNKVRTLIRHYVFAKSVEIPPRPVGFSEKALGEASEMLLDYWIQQV